MSSLSELLIMTSPQRNLFDRKPIQYSNSPRNKLINSLRDKCRLRLINNRNVL